jgi:hypothetical protein
MTAVLSPLTTTVCLGTIASNMNESTRRAIAYIAGRASSGRSSAAIFDYSNSAHFNFSGKVTDSAVSAYDYTEQCHITGAGHSGSFSLYHYGYQKHISLRVDGRKFRGYDFASGLHFSGTVSGRAVSIFDYADSTWHQYAI